MQSWMRSLSPGWLVLLAGCGAGLVREEPPAGVSASCQDLPTCRALADREALRLRDCDADFDAPRACESAAEQLAEVRRRIELFEAAPPLPPAPPPPPLERPPPPPAPVDLASVLEDTTARCIVRNEPPLCDRLRAEADRAACRARCDDRVRRTKERLVEQAIEACAGRVVEQGGEPVCRFDRGDGVTRTWTPEERAEECAAECAQLAQEQQRRSQLRVRCCDGSRSPSCTYAAIRSGCCLHHGGVCGE